MFKQLSKKIDSDNPTQFRLPTEIRQYFVGGESHLFSWCGVGVEWRAHGSFQSAQAPGVSTWIPRRPVRNTSEWMILHRPIPISQRYAGLTSGITSRKGFQEERDGTRLRDGKARPVACYACGGSSIPLRSLTTDPEASWRQIVSCDHCALHWHLDCLNPPLASMPNSGRKWMCPNHAEQVMVRTARTTAPRHDKSGDGDDVAHPVAIAVAVADADAIF